MSAIIEVARVETLKAKKDYEKKVKLAMLRFEDNMVKESWLGAWQAKALPFYFQPKIFKKRHPNWTARFLMEKFLRADVHNGESGFWYILPVQRECSHEIRKWGKHIWNRRRMLNRLAWLKELKESELSDDLITLVFREWL